MSASSLRLGSETDGDLVDAVVAVLGLPIVRNGIATMLVYDYSADLEAGLKSVNDALNMTVAEHVKTAGRVDVAGPTQLDVSDGVLVLSAVANGAVVLEIGH